MNKALRQKIWAIAESYLEKVTYGHGGHGINHVKRVHANFGIFRKDLLSRSPAHLVEGNLDALEVAVQLHDIGNSVARKDHARHSVEILDKLFANRLSDIPNKKLVRRIISEHSTGLQGEAKTIEDASVGMMVVFDHMDSIGSVGMLRIFRDWLDSRPILPDFIAGGWSLEEALLFLENPTELGIDRVAIRHNSIFGNLFFNYCATFRICQPIEGFIAGTCLKQEIEKRTHESQMFIKGMIRNANQFSI